MKQFLMTAICSIVLVLGAPLVAPSQTVHVRPSILPENRDARVVRSIQPTSLGNNNGDRTRSEMTYAVTPKLKDNPDNGVVAYFVQYAVPHNGRWSQLSFFLGDGFSPFDLTPDTYDFIFFFESSTAYYVVVREGIDVKSDMDINVSWEEAINKMECEFVLPDGQQIEPPIYDIEKDTVTKGNIVMGSCETLIYSKDGIFKFLSSNGYEAYIYEGDLLSSVGSNTVYVNPNNVIEVAWMSNVALENGPTVISTVTSKDCQSGKFMNALDGYSEIQTVYGDALNADKDSGVIGGTLSYAIRSQNRAAYMLTTSYLTSQDLTWDSSRVLYQNQYSSDLKICPTLNNMMVYDSDYNQVFGIAGPICEPTPDPNLYNALTQLTWNSYYDAGYDNYHGNQLLDYYITTDSPKYIGYTTPGIVIMRDNVGHGGCSFVCRDGSNRDMDFFASKINVSNDGKEICTDPKDLYGCFFDEEWNPIVYDGSWDYNVESENITVDGKVAKSTLNLHIDQDDDYFSTPAIPQVQFRNLSGKQEESFSAIQDMVMIVEAGRYHYFEEFDEVRAGWSHYWESEPVESVEVEISSPNMNGTVAVPVRLQDTVTDSDYLGTAVTYLSDLEDLDIELEDGWYDLTVRLKDGKDYCEQFIERAFKIDRSLNGVTAPMGQDNEVYVQDGRIVMPEGSRVYTIDGRQVSADAAVKGMYIVVTPRQGYRVVL